VVSTGSWRNKLGFWAAFALTSTIGTFVGLGLIMPTSSPPAPAVTPVAANSLGDWADPVSGSPRDPLTGLPKRVVARVSGLELVLVPAGTYERGTNPRPDRRWVPPDEQPAHRVSISQPFYLGATKVTQAQWTKVAGLNPSRFRKDGDFPVEGISFVDVSSYLRRVGLRLPSEAEWEYACKAGGDDPVISSPDPAGALAGIGWYLGNSGRSTQPVNLKRENQLGLKDLFGDVTEWTSSWYDSAEYHRSAPSVTDPRGPEEGREVVVRGCTFASPVEQCHCAQRGHANPETRNFIGLRVAHDAL